MTNLNTKINPAGYGEDYERPLKSISDADLLNKINDINEMGMIELCDCRNELVARRYTLFNNDGEKLQEAISPYAALYKAKFL